MNADMDVLSGVMFGFGMIVSAAAIWFLIRERGAFGGWNALRLA